MQYKRCPRCDLNMIPINEEYCDLCKKELGILRQKQDHSKKSKYNNNNCMFIIMNEIVKDDKVEGLKLLDVFDSDVRWIGVVREIKEKNDNAIGYSEFHFFSRYYDEYGEWHRFRINGERILFNDIKKMLIKQNTININIDAR